jgi:hypothetical protein
LKFDPDLDPHWLAPAFKSMRIFNTVQLSLNFYLTLIPGLDTDKHKYPIGSGRVTFNNRTSYMKASLTLRKELIFNF